MHKFLRGIILPEVNLIIKSRVARWGCDQLAGIENGPFLIFHKLQISKIVLQCLTVLSLMIGIQSEIITIWNKQENGFEYLSGNWGFVQSWKKSSLEYLGNNVIKCSG